jgi:hypothetical protein
VLCNLDTETAYPKFRAPCPHIAPTQLTRSGCTLPRWRETETRRWREKKFKHGQAEGQTRPRARP